MSIGNDTELASREIQYVRYGQPGYDEYMAEVRALESNFAYDLHQEYLPGFPDEVAALVYREAWEDGHSSGYQSVESEYEDAALLITRITDILGVTPQA